MVSTEFLDKTKNLSPDPQLVKAVEQLLNKETALDLGAGGGRDTKYLLEQGFSVTAVDIDPKIEPILKSLPNQDKLDVKIANFNNFEFATYDLINARYSLPFTPKELFNELFENIKSALNPHGMFVGQFFGVNDSWNRPDSNMSFFTKEESEQMLGELKVITFVEEDKDGQTATGESKHWHVFHILAEKPKWY